MEPGALHPRSAAKEVARGRHDPSAGHPSEGTGDEIVSLDLSNSLGRSSFPHPVEPSSTFCAPLDPDQVPCRRPVVVCGPQRGSGPPDTERAALRSQRPRKES